MATIPQSLQLGIKRNFTEAGKDPYSYVEWEKRDSRITNYRDGSVAFEQLGVEVPSFWSVNATNILAQKYFRGTMGTAERETSLKQVADRIVDTITRWGRKDGYFTDDETASAFSDELKYALVNQMVAFNSPVWFNIGVNGVPQQASACFILAVDDDMNSILNWYTEEGVIFKGGSGSGINLSRIRSSKELLKGGGTASGPVSFMRGADASAGTIKSGGKTRRAAKMVMLDVDHPDVEEFIWCKAIEENKARALKAAGFDMDLDGKDSFSIQYQNANNSVRVTDEFMEAVIADADWDLKAVTTGETIKTLRARELFRQISKAAWECADPGVQYDSTINRWHTAPNYGKINGSNPCSEYMHVDNSACNLASLNLMKFLQLDNSFDVEAFQHVATLTFIAQDILVGNADYPTEKIGANSKRFRQLGIGYANIGALVMNLGLPYDSDGARAYAGAITALLTGSSYLTSVRMARALGPFAGFADDRDAMLNVLSMHKGAVETIDSSHVPSNILEAARAVWQETTEGASIYGVRNAQASVLAPTGTIGLLMDCDTTGVEPDLGLVKMKKLVGGGTMSIVNQSVPRALHQLGYSNEVAGEIVKYVNENGTIVGAPGLDPQDLPVFACSMGDNTIHYLGHVKMMAAVQPFISGAISKTVNMPEDATVEEIESLYIDAWKMGVKAVAIYRDNCKVGQPLSTSKKSDNETTIESTLETMSADEANRRIAELERDLKGQTTVVVKRPVRERLPRRRRSSTFAFRVADCEGYVTVGEYEDGRPGEIFMKVSKQGSTLAGIMDAFSISVSLGLQHGVPLETFVRKYTNMRFEPAGMTDDPELRIASSLVDYIFRRLAIDYLSESDRADLGVLTTDERLQPTLFAPQSDETLSEAVDEAGYAPEVRVEIKGSSVETSPIPQASDAPYCYSCGNAMQRAGSCFVCSACGSTSGCS
ncbi:MAG: vitamin B12-dependent ribonucleotide reductase [Actinomycetota bacterium]|nr:vitamin B12-dependent ribonucleotide reductase [Actinomycetota bacterium]